MFRFLANGVCSCKFAIVVTPNKVVVQCLRMREFVKHLFGAKLVGSVRFGSVIVVAHETRLVYREPLAILRMLKIFLKQNGQFLCGYYLIPLRTSALRCHSLFSLYHFFEMEVHQWGKVKP